MTRYVSYCVGAVVLVIAAGRGIPADKAVPRSKQQFESVVVPFLKTNCISCHGPEKQKGKLTLHDINSDPRDEKAVAQWERVMEQLEIGEMPPATRPQPSAVARDQVVQWIRDHLSSAGKAYLVRSKLLLPEYGNRVNHELLFNGTIKDMPASPSRLWRISPFIYKGKGLQQRPGPGGEPLTYLSKTDGIRDYSSQEIVGEAGFLSLMMAFDDLLSKQIHDDRDLPANASFKAVVDAKGMPANAVMERVIREEFLRTVGRSITDDELVRYRKFMVKNIEQAGNPSGLKVTILAIYLSPEAIYRMELGLGKADEFGRRLLSPQELAFAIAFALTDAPPSKLPIIKETLAKNQLATKADVEKVVRRLLAEGAPPTQLNLPGPFDQLRAQGERGYAYLPRVQRFFEEFFEYPKAAGAFKDGKHGSFGPRAVPGVAQGHIAAIVNADKHVFEELLTSRRFNYNRDQILARLKADYEKRLKTLPEDRRADATKHYESMCKAAAKVPYETARAGILTDPSWLIAHSKCTENDPVRRGKWIRERLLAGNVPDLPIGVDAKIPEDHDRTLRQRFAVVEAGACWKCHKMMNPLGMAFERYNDVGRIRTGMWFDKKNQDFLEFLDEKEAAKLVKDGAIVAYTLDTSGVLTGTGDPDLDGEVKDAVDLVQRLARSARVRQSIIRHAFRYWMGRNETLSDSKTLIAADQAYVKSGGKFSEVIVALLTSDSFLYRR